MPCCIFLDFKGLTHQIFNLECAVLSRSVVSDSVTLWTVAHQAPLSMRILQPRILECVAMPSSWGSSQPRSPALQADSLLSEPPGKPKNTGVGSLSLLQQIFPTQESNRDLLHCRRFLYQLSYQGSPMLCWEATKHTFTVHPVAIKSGGAVRSLRGGR